MLYLLFLKLLSDLSCGGLNALGGYHWLFCRRFIMPFIIGLSFAIITHTWWVLFLPLPVMGTLVLGYFSPKNWGRALWLFLQAVVIGLGITITGHLAWYFYLIYVVGAGILGGIYRGWEQIIGDAITGCYLGSILFLVR